VVFIKQFIYKDRLNQYRTHIEVLLFRIIDFPEVVTDYDNIVFGFSH